MDNSNNMFINWDEQGDNGLLGSLFPQGFNPNVMQPLDLIQDGKVYNSPFVKTNKSKDDKVKTDSSPTVFENVNLHIIYVETVKNGSAVLEAYNNRKIEKNDIVFFCETNDGKQSNLFGTFLLVKYGSGYRELLNNLISKKKPFESIKNSTTVRTIKTFDDEVQDNFERLTKIYKLDVDIDKVNYVMYNELVVNSTAGKTLSDAFDWYNGGVATVVDSINDWLEDLKFTRPNYMPEKPVEQNFLEQVAEDIEKAIKDAIPPKVKDFITDTLETALSKIKGFIKANLPEGWVLLLKKVYRVIKNMLELYVWVVDTLVNSIQEIFLLARALVMGFINGLISTIQTIISIVGWLIKNNIDKVITGKYYRIINNYVEFVEDFFDLVKDKVSDVYGGVKALIEDFSLDKIMDTFSVFGDALKDATKDITRYDIAFFIGSFVFEVILGVLLTVLTEGGFVAAKAAEVLKDGAAVFKIYVKEIISTATGGLIDIFQFFRVLITKFAQACTKGWKGFKQFLKNLMSSKMDDVAKEEGKVLDNVVGNGLYSGKILTQNDLDDWGKMLYKKFKTTLEKVDGFDDPKVLAQFDPNTNTIKYKEGVTEYFMAHESFHAEEMEKIGFKDYVKDAPLKGTKYENYTSKNWQRLYKREKYVYDNLLKNAEKFGLNEEELDHAFYYFDGWVIGNLEKNNIKIPKI